MHKRIILVCGHYGSGKTNLALNLAIMMRSRGDEVTLVDMDIVNPYFRSSDYARAMEIQGIEVVAPATAGTTVDAPALTAQMLSVTQTNGRIVIDVGGDDVGAAALGRFAPVLSKREDWEMLYVINKYRKLVDTPAQATALMREIEAASRLKATGVVNNSHLCSLTTAEDILSSVPYAEQTAASAGLPLVMTTAPKTLETQLTGKIADLFPVDILVTLPWNGL